MQVLFRLSEDLQTLSSLHADCLPHCMQVLFRLSEDLQTLSWEKKGLQGLGKDMAMGFGKMMGGGFAKSADTARRVDLSTLVEVLQVRACLWRLMTSDGA